MLAWWVLIFKGLQTNVSIGYSCFYPERNDYLKLAFHRVCRPVCVSALFEPATFELDSERVKHVEKG